MIYLFDALQLAVLLCCLVACQAGLVPATTLFRAPSHDSAIIRSDRLGGNFAYSVQEGHAYAAVSPVVQHVAHPVAVSYQVPAVSAPAVVAPAVVAPAAHVVEASVEHRALPYVASYPGAHYTSYGYGVHAPLALY